VRYPGAGRPDGPSRTDKGRFMDEQARESAFMSALITEHFVLQSAASTTVSEAASRASLYVFSVSSTLVAIGFTAQVPAVFGPFVATVLPGVFLLGCFTVVRLVDTTVENNQNLRAIARIRRYYRTLTPDAERFFASWGRSDDDASEALAMLGTRPRAFTVLFTMASMVAMINSLIAGVSVALLVGWLTEATANALSIGLGAAAAIAFFVGAYRYQVHRYSGAAAAERARWAPGESTSSA
jgi:hypothetical protein